MMVTISLVLASQRQVYFHPKSSLCIPSGNGFSPVFPVNYYFAGSNLAFDLLIEIGEQENGPTIKFRGKCSKNKQEAPQTYHCHCDSHMCMDWKRVVAKQQSTLITISRPVPYIAD